MTDSLVVDPMLEVRYWMTDSLVMDVRSWILDDGNEFID